MKEAFEFIKKLWQNKRTRALSILIIYIIFFIFVFSIINSSSNTVTDATDKFSELKNIQIKSYSVVDKDENIVEDYDLSILSGDVIYQIVKNSTLESTNYRDNSNTYYLSIIDYEKIKNNITIQTSGAIRTTVSDKKIVLDFSEYYGYIIRIER